MFPTTERPSDAYKGVTFPVLTEMAYFLESTNEVNIFIVGLATEMLPFKPSTFKFLQGLGYAIYVAAFLMKDNEGIYPTNDASNVELDHKEFVPKSTIVTPYISAVNLAAIGGTVDVYSIKKNISDANLKARSYSDLGVVKARGASFVSLVDHMADHDDDNNNIGMMLSDSPPTLPSVRKSVSIAQDMSPLASMSAALRYTEDLKRSHDSAESGDYAEGEQEDSFNEQAISNRYEIQTRNRAPTWDPTYPFSYPVGDIPSDNTIPDDLNDSHFSKTTHLTDGSNSNIYTAMYRGEKVIIKMIKKGMETDAIALHEFDLEYGMLSRIRHPHVIRILGAGYEPRRFMVLEYLSGGSLSSLLEQNEAKKGFANMMFRKPTFTYAKLLQKASDMAEALDYLHFHCHEGATIIHRGTACVHCIYHALTML